MTRPAADPPLAIEMRGVRKRFGAVLANDDVTLRVRPGTIHGLIGENGAGKSTLMSILYGFYHADAGEIRIHGRQAAIRDSRDAIRLGVGMVHQHFMLVEPFTVLENVTLGAEGGPLLARGAAAARTALAQLGRDYALEVDPDAVVSDLPVGRRQRVEILKALLRGADILILDEPTGALTPAEADHLFRILRQLRAQGKTILLITHKLREIMAVADSVSVMRRGRMVADRATADTTPEELAALMVGRPAAPPPPKAAVAGAPALAVRNLRVNGPDGPDGAPRVEGVSFDVRAGEIVGLAGVSGEGQTDLLEALAGMRPIAGGSVTVNGAPLAADPAAVRAQGVAHVPEDRSRVGLALPFMAYENAALGWSDAYARGPWLDRRRLQDDARRQQTAFDVRPPDIFLKTANFSGGNQQKIILAREFDQDPTVLLIGQPTRGVDIGAIEFIHRRILEMAAAGKAILLASLELDEIRALADRVLVMYGGAIVGACAPDADEQELGLMMAGMAGMAETAEMR